MISLFSKRKIIILILVLVTFCLYFVQLPQIFYVNVSASLPYGLYKIEKNPSWQKGAIVAFFLPEKVNFMKSRNWLSLTVPLLKPVVALEGDHCCIQNEEIKINGQKYGDIAKVDTDGLNLPQISFCRDLAEDEIWVGSNRIKNSFDSRYFGTIPKNTILAIIKPWLVLR